MGRIPEDARHWDSGDWIEWHRTEAGLIDTTVTAAAQDPMARLTALQVNMLRAAKGYYELTGCHLPVYDAIAQVLAATTLGVPLEGPGRTCEASGIEIVCIAPHGPTNIVSVDLDSPFRMLVVVRIKDNFTCEARVLSRADLPQGASGRYDLSWQSIPPLD